MSSYIFILCPPYSGSTVLWKLVSTSSSVSSLPSEGQFLPEVKEIMRLALWNADVKLPWGKIKEVWDGYWNQSKPLLVEKSPPNMIRTRDIVEYFSPVYFLIMIRNPYAHCEGLIRRNRWNAKKAVDFTVRCMRQQAENSQKLSNSLCFTYEELVERPEVISHKIRSFIPQIGVLNHAQKFQVHSIDGHIEKGIVDLNRKKIDNLSLNELKQINDVLKRNADIMEYWGYKYFEPSFNHTFTYLRARSSFLLGSFVRAGRLIRKRVW